VWAMLSQGVLILGNLVPTRILPHTEHWQKLIFIFFPLSWMGIIVKEKGDGVFYFWKR